MDPWWTDQQAGLIGAAVGVLGGTLGAAYGILNGVCVVRGKHRRLVSGLAAFALMLGTISLAAGIVAVAMGQPFHVWWLPTLFGIVMIPIFRTVPLIGRRCQQSQPEQMVDEQKWS